MNSLVIDISNGIGWVLCVILADKGFYVFGSVHKQEMLNVYQWNLPVDLRHYRLMSPMKLRLNRVT